MTKPLTQWYCDVCGGLIKNVKDGYVVWDTDKEGKVTVIKVIHQSKCDDDSLPNSTALEDFLGTDGLSHLLSLMSAGPIINNGKNRYKKGFADIDVFVDLVRRLHVPNYEEARRRFSDSELRSDYYDANEIAPYLQRDLVHIIEKYGKED